MQYAKHIRKHSVQSALIFFGIAHHVNVKAEAGNVYEKAVPGHSCVYQAAFAAREHVHKPFVILRQAYAARKVVARAERQHAKLYAGIVLNNACHFVKRSVPANGHKARFARIYGGLGKLHGVARIFAEAEAVLYAPLFKYPAHKRETAHALA